MPEENASKQPLVPPKTEAGGKHLRHETYKDELFRILCKYLDQKLSDEGETTETGPLALEKDVLADRQHRRKLGKGIAISACVIAVVILLVLYAVITACTWDIFIPCPKTGMNGWAAVVFISGSFLSFVVVYTIAIKGLFQQPKEEEFSSPIKEVLEILQKLRGEE